MVKVCFKCNVEKDISEFYKQKGMADGHLGKCKICTRGDTKKRQQENKERVYVEKRKYHKENPEVKANGRKKYREKFPEKYAAVTAVGIAIRQGRLTKQPCEICGGNKTEAHHDDYSKPLDVRWLCPEHHKQHHVNQRELEKVFL